MESYSESPFLTLKFCGILPEFSSSTFSISGFRLWSFIHLEIIFVQGDRYESNFIFSACRHSVFPAPFLEDDIFSLVYVLLPLCQISGIVLMFESSVFFHYFTSLFFHLYHIVFITTAL